MKLYGLKFARATFGLVAAAAIGSGGVAYAASELAPARIVVLGTGKVEVPPDVATMNYSVRGEGVTAEAAAKVLVARQRAIESGLAALVESGPTRLSINSSNLNIEEVRGKDCQNDVEDEKPVLSTGSCAVLGYVATLKSWARLTPVKGAGTLVARAAQLGATNPSLANFGIANTAEAKHRAIAAALANAHDVAAAIASSSGGHLGRLVSVDDQEARNLLGVDEVVVTAQRRQFVAPPDIELIPIDLAPESISVSASLVVTYAIEP